MSLACGTVDGAFRTASILALGSHLSAGIKYQEMRANMVTIAIIIGASAVFIRWAFKDLLGRTSELTIQGCSCNGKLVRREQYRDNPGVPEYPNNLEWSAPFSKAPSGLGKLVGSKNNSAKAYQPVGCCRRHTSCRDQRGEGDTGRENSATDDSCNNPDNDYGILWLPIHYLCHPPREWKDSVAGNGKDKP